jgi:hypothetical protein
MKNHEIWRINYRNNRYMEYISKEELEQRAKDIFSNLIILSPEGNCSLRKVNNDGLYWMIIWTELLEEFVIRYGNHPSGFESGFMKDSKIIKTVIYNEAKIAIDKIGGIKDNCIYKYSKKQYNLESLKNGRFRIAPASFYNDASLNYAIKDNELIFDIFNPPKDITVTLLKNNQTINLLGNVKRTYELSTNYYVQCLSTAYTYREFNDFEADSCLIIYDIQRFVEKIRKELLKKFKNFEFYFDNIEYIDPLKHKREPSVLFSKHFRYSYQNECRFVFLPEEPILDLKEFFIEIGSMEEYAEIITINKVN